MNPRIEARQDEFRNSAPPEPVVTWRSWLVWGIAALFYLTGFYQRVSPAVMTSELMHDFGLGAKSLGSLSAFYFYFYVAMQVPVGVLIDSWGARKLLFWGALSAAAGTFLFGATSNFALACAGRAIVGGATAAGWLVLLKLATHWFPARRFAMLSGLGLFFGNVGALFAQVPLRLLIEHFGWRDVVLCSSIILVGVCVAVWLAVQNDPSDAGLESHAPAVLRADRRTMRALGAGFRKVFAYRNTWFIFFAQGGIVGPILAFTGLWGTPFLAVQIRLAAGASRRGLLGHDRVLGGRESNFRRTVRPDRPAKANLPAGCDRIGDRLDRHVLCQLAAGGICRGRGVDEFRQRRGGARLRIREGVGPSAISGNDLGRGQHREHDRAHAAAARHRTDARQELGGADGEGRAPVRSAGLPRRVSAGGVLGSGLVFADCRDQRDLLPASRVAPRRFD